MSSVDTISVMVRHSCGHTTMEEVVNNERAAEEARLMTLMPCEGCLEAELNILEAYNNKPKAKTSSKRTFFNYEDPKPLRTMMEAWK